MMILLFIAIGLGAGVLSGLFGIGGGVVIVPALLLLARMPALTATGTSLAALLLPVGALGAWEYHKTGHLDMVAALWIALGLLFGAYAGARLAQHASPVQLKRAFSVFLLLIAARIWTS
jgi:uncharacterized membrane protein YfcA